MLFSRNCITHTSTKFCYYSVQEKTQKKIETHTARDREREKREKTIENTQTHSIVSVGRVFCCLFFRIDDNQIVNLLT